MKRAFNLLTLAIGLRCPERIWPEFTEPEYRCFRVRWHGGTHRDPHGDAWEGNRR